MEFELLPLDTIAADTFLSHLTLACIPFYSLAPLTKRTVQPPLPTLILYRLAPSLSYLTSPVLLPHSDRLVCLRSAVTQHLFAQWSGQSNTLDSSQAAIQTGGAWMGSVWTIWLPFFFSQCPAGHNLPRCSHPRRTSMQIHYAKPTSRLVRTHLAWLMISVRLPWWKICSCWVCARNAGKRSAFCCWSLLSLQSLLAPEKPASPRGKIDRYEMRRPIKCRHCVLVVSILFSIHHNEPVCHVSHGKH